MSTAAIVGLILLGILVGAIVPVLYQAAQTLKSARRQIDALGPRVDQALKELTDVTQRINRIATTVEDQTDRLRPVVDSVVGIGHALNKVRNSVSRFSSVIGAVGPAVVAGLGAFLAQRRARSSTTTVTEDESEDETGRIIIDDRHPDVAPPNTRAAVPEDHYDH
jgi:uncharacterized protein YoxC